MSCSIDLHIHTTASDGTVSPTKILQNALQKKMKYISLTDHESIQGYKELLPIKTGWENLITVIPGVELHTFFQGHEIHLLGYFVDHTNKNLNLKLKELRAARTEISYETVQNLKKSGINIEWGDVLNLGKSDVAITKAHIIGAIKKINIPINKSIFYNYFNPQGDYYLQYKDHTLEEAISLIKEAQGIPVLAHPGLIGDDTIVREILAKYKIGLEVYYHYFGDKAKVWINKYEEMAQKYNVLATGGSDYHGTITPVEIGDTYVPDEIIKKLTKAKYNS